MGNLNNCNVYLTSPPPPLSTFICNSICLTPFLQAEKDSKTRRETVNKICQKLNGTNILEPPADHDDKLRARQRYNLLKHLIVNEEHKVLYCYIPKVSCTNMKKIFVVMDGLYPSVEEVSSRAVHSGTILSLGDKKFTKKQRRDMLKNFYKFMIVREPFERLVSAYRNKFQNKALINTKTAQKGGDSIFIKYVRHLGKAIIRKYRYKNTGIAKTGANIVSFTEYVRYLIDTPPWAVNEHWMPYEDLCRPCDVNYDFIGSIDTLERDVRHIMRQIHANETKYHLMHTNRALTKTKRTIAGFFKQLPQKYFDQLLAIRKTDFELFGYPLPDYKTLDKHYQAS